MNYNLPVNRGVKIGTKSMTKINLYILELSTQSLSKLNDIIGNTLSKLSIED